MSVQLPPYRALLAGDIESYSARPGDALPAVLGTLQRVVRESMRRCDLDWSEAVFPQVTGDSFVLGLASERLPVVLDRFLPELQLALADEAAALPRRVGAVRLRCAVHVGPVPDSGVCTPMTEVHRLLDCQPVREALARTDPEVTFLAAIVSEAVVNDVVKAGYSRLRPGELTRVRARVKRFDQPAFVFVPKPSGPGLGSGFAGPTQAPPVPPTPGTSGTPGPSGTSAANGTSVHNVVSDARVNGFVIQSGGNIVGGIQAPVTVQAAPASRTCPVPADELATAARRHAGLAPPDVLEARRQLRERHLVVLAGDPGDRRHAALWLLGELAERDRIEIVDVVRERARPAVAGLPLDARTGSVLELKESDRDRPDTPFAEELLLHALRLAQHGSYLVVTVPPRLWGACWPVLPAVRLVRQRDSGGTDQGEESLRLVDPEGSDSVYPLRTDLGAPRGLVTLGRATPHAAPPDIVLDADPRSWISRDHLRLEFDDGHWWLVPRSDNRPLLLPRGGDEPSRVEDRTRLRDGDQIHIAVRPGQDGRSRHWRIEFTDPHDTRRALGPGAAMENGENR
ncbi:FHA domain-containing protein [Streptomyces sp. NPDC127098]|uniref:FHA domain-containing protein n=1 Tax=Streptomyces sp. NPDC127098 TaxID=3347137 RepID=UPI003664FCE7